MQKVSLVLILFDDLLGRGLPLLDVQVHLQRAVHENVEYGFRGLREHRAKQPEGRVRLGVAKDPEVRLGHQVTCHYLDKHVLVTFL